MITYIFDLDGTLIDSSEGIVKSVIETIHVMKLEELSEEFIKECIGPPIADSIGKKVGYSQETINQFYDVFRPIYKNNHLMECKIYDGIVNMLKCLKKSEFKLGIATNKRVDYTKTLLSSIGLLDYFNTVCALDLEGKKNKTQIVKDCMNNLNAHPEECVMIGDSRSDQEAAVACGIKFIGVGYGFGFHSAEDVQPPGEYIDTVDALKTRICCANTQ